VSEGRLENWALDNMPASLSRKAPFNSQPLRQSKFDQVSYPGADTFPALPDTISQTTARQEGNV